jgi:hypothetical protein
MKYINDATRYASDLTEAAQAGDWETYRNVQAELAAETTLQVLSGAAQAEQGRQAAMEEVSRTYPHFEVFRETDSYREILNEHKALARAIAMAESNVSVQQDLPELYKLVADCAKADQAYDPGYRHAPHLQEIRGEFTPGSLAEENVFRATQEAKRADLSSRNRKALIAELEASGAADLEF